MTSSFHSLHDFFTMGSYGVYVWSTYAIALVIVVMNIFNAHRKGRLMRKKLLSEYQHQTPLSTKTPTLSYDES